MILLRLTAVETDDGLRVELSSVRARSPRQEDVIASGMVRASFSGLAREIRDALTGGASDPSEPAHAASISERLTAAALPLEVRDRLVSICERREEPVRIWVCIDERPGAQAKAWWTLPWEFLSLSASGSFRVEAIAGRMASVQIVRSVDRDDVGMARPDGDLSLLVLHADPMSQAFPHLPLAAQEADAVASSGSWFAQTRSVKSVTPSTFKRAMEEFRPTALHFVGHGYDAVDGGGLVLQGARDGTEEKVSAKDLAGWMSESGVRVCVLSCCWSAARPLSLAYELVRAGVQASVGIQFDWRDSAGGLFANGLYGALAHGATIEEAVTLGRQALIGMGVDWAAPALLTAASDIAFRPSQPAAPFLVPLPSNPDFVGREAYLQQISSALHDEPLRPIAVVGIGGIGKTSLAVEAAHRFRSDFPDGVFWIDARDGASLDFGYAQAGEALGVPSDLPVSERSRMAREKLSALTRSSLLVLDNVTEHGICMPIAGRTRVLLTTREKRHVPPAALLIEPEALDAVPALQILGRAAWSSALSTDAGAEEIVEMVGGLPLALSLAAKHMQRTGLGYSEYALKLKSHRVDTLESARRRFISTTEHDGSIFDAIDLAWGSLPAPARRVLTGACCFAARGIPRRMLQEVCLPDDMDGFDEAMADLWDSSLVTFEEGRRLRVHELVRVCVQAQKDQGAVRAVTSAVASRLTEELRRANEAMDWREVRRELHHVRAVIERCRRLELKTGLCELLLEYGVCLEEIGETRSAENPLRESVTLSEELHGRSHRNTARALWRFGEVMQSLGDNETALSSLVRAREIGDEHFDRRDPLLAEIYNGLGLVQRFQNRLDEAQSNYEIALDLLTESVGEPSLPVSVTLNNLGTLAEARGETDTAIAYLERASEGLRASCGDSHRLLGAMLNSAGRVYFRSGRIEEAVIAHRTALEVNDTYFGRNNPHSGMSLVYLGRAVSKEDMAEGCALFGEGIAILHGVFRPDHPAIHHATALRPGPEERK